MAFANKKRAEKERASSAKRRGSLLLLSPLYLALSLSLTPPPTTSHSHSQYVEGDPPEILRPYIEVCCAALKCFWWSEVVLTPLSTTPPTSSGASSSPGRRWSTRASSRRRTTRTARASTERGLGWQRGWAAGRWADGGRWRGGEAGGGKDPAGNRSLCCNDDGARATRHTTAAHSGGVQQAGSHADSRRPLRLCSLDAVLDDLVHAAGRR